MPSRCTSSPPCTGTIGPPFFSCLLHRSGKQGSMQAGMFTVCPPMATHTRIYSMEHFGPPRFLGSPLVPLPCSSRPRSRLTAMPFRQFGVAPAEHTTKAATIAFSRLIHTASALAVYASRFGFPYTGKTRFRWVANPYRVGFEPTGLLWRISSRLRQPIYSNAPGFAWRQCPLHLLSDFRIPTCALRISVLRHLSSVIGSQIPACISANNA
jgi:hypothetical protein